MFKQIGFSTKWARAANVAALTLTAVILALWGV
jgi:hypothetical protein